jgi:hypothetical protein
MNNKFGDKPAGISSGTPIHPLADNDSQPISRSQPLSLHRDEYDCDFCSRGPIRNPGASKRVIFSPVVDLSGADFAQSENPVQEDRLDVKRFGKKFLKTLSGIKGQDKAGFFMAFCHFFPIFT